MIRPEYLACIADGHADNAGKSWCGRYIRFEFHFVNVDHAAISGRNENRLVACSECTAEIKKSLSNGQVDTTPGSTLKVMRGPGGGLYLSGVEDLREGDVFRREVRG